MAVRTRKADTNSWANKLDGDEVREALEQACIDAYDEDEQHTGRLRTLIGDELQFPFEARGQGADPKCPRSGNRSMTTD